MLCLCYRTDMHVFIPVHFHAPLGGLQAHVIAQLRAVHRAGGRVTVMAPDGPFADLVRAEGARFLSSSATYSAVGIKRQKIMG